MLGTLDDLLGRCTEREKVLSLSRLVYKLEDFMIYRVFRDEVSAYRARRLWPRIFGEHMLLDVGRDYRIRVMRADNGWAAVCECTSACGRYAFTRLANAQAPECEDRLASC